MLFTIDQLAVNNFRILDPEITLLCSVAAEWQVASNEIDFDYGTNCAVKFANPTRDC